MTLILRYVFGLFLILMGANKFLGFMPAMEMTEEANSFIGALVSTGYMMPMVGTVELLCGCLFLFQSTAPLATVLLAPLSVNIILFHLFLDISTIAMAAVVFVMNGIFAVMFFDYYRPIFAKIFTEKVLIQSKKPSVKQKTVAVVN
ncbi:MAG: DoxX protein [Halobacteriovoraceae bacterium]|nr:DoxX protein [Halobacteriovoraceae bacterium]MCB9095513.1 DoxX protein [Halobacteriovoraceae bacterium]